MAYSWGVLWRLKILSLGKLDLELGHVNLSTESVGRFLFVGRFEKQLDGLAQIDLGIFKRLPLAWDVQFRSQGDESIAFSFENGGKGFGHAFAPLIVVRASPLPFMCAAIEPHAFSSHGPT